MTHQRPQTTCTDYVIVHNKKAWIERIDIKMEETSLQFLVLQCHFCMYGHHQPSVCTQENSATLLVREKLGISQLNVCARRNNLTIIPRTRVGYELLDSERGAEHRVGYHKLISSKGEWNNCLLNTKHWIKLS